MKVNNIVARRPYLDITLVGLLFMSCAIFFISGCMTLPNSDSAIHPYQVNIVTDPPGARIEINKNYAGDSPLTVNVLGHPNGTFFYTTHIVAYPIYSGQCVQYKRFSETMCISGIGCSVDSIGRGDPIPQTIFFDMHLCPQEPSLSVNVQN